MNHTRRKNQFPRVSTLFLVSCWSTACGTTTPNQATLHTATPSDTQGPSETATPQDSAGPDVLRGPLQLAFPLPDPADFNLTIGVDHDPTDQPNDLVGRATCLDFALRSFPYCYDGHDGSDFILRGGFSRMDAGSPDVLAAAPGTVISTEDGHYDRCHASVETGDVDCDGNPIIANHVILLHQASDGSQWRTLYWHLQNGSVAVSEGEVVDAGTRLGRVGSSGYSSMPHLHFELQDIDENTIDPFAGEGSQQETYWCEQGPIEGFPGPCD